MAMMWLPTIPSVLTTFGVNGVVKAVGEPLSIEARPPRGWGCVHKDPKLDLNIMESHL